MGSRFGANIQVILCSIRYVMVPTHKKENIYACALPEGAKSAEIIKGRKRLHIPKKWSMKTETMNFVNFYLIRLNYVGKRSSA